MTVCRIVCGPSSGLTGSQNRVCGQVINPVSGILGAVLCFHVFVTFSRHHVSWISIWGCREDSLRILDYLRLQSVMILRID